MNLTRIDNITPVDNSALDIWNAAISMAENLSETMEGIASIYMHFWYSRSKKQSQRPIRSKGGILDQVNRAVRQFEEITRIHDTYKALWAADSNTKETLMSPPELTFDHKENKHVLGTPYDDPSNFWGEDIGSASPISDEPESASARGTFMVGTPTDTPPMALKSFMHSKETWSESIMSMGCGY